MLILPDIGGVLIPANSWKSPELLDDGFPAFSIKATDMLQRIAVNDPEVVLTSSHKSNFSIN